MISHLTNLIKEFNIFKSINGVIHVGGHTGEEIPLYMENNWNVMIFEPQKSCFDEIPNNEKIKKYNLALGASEKELLFYIASNVQSSSFLKPHLHLQEHPHINFQNNCYVRQYPLDNFNTENYEFMVIDVQGYELEVLKGSEKTLNNIKCIYTEVNSNLLYENCVLIDELDSWLSKKGFIRKATELTQHGWGDALYIKE